MLPYGFATLAELKARLGINTSITDHNTTLQEIINGVSGAIESIAGRQLRRSHRTVEFFTGGGYLIRTRMAPIAKVHSIRESDTRDFETSDSYEELTEDATDGFMLERDAMGRESGASGFIRRLGQKWLGNANSPGLIRVEYTGGYKSEEEIALENATVILSGNTVLDYGIEWGGGDDDPYRAINADDSAIYVGLAASTTRRGALRFATSNIILPAWTIVEASLTYTAFRTTDSGVLQVFAVKQDPMLRGDLQGIYDSSEDDDSTRVIQQTLTGVETTRTEDVLDNEFVADTLAVFHNTLRNGFLGFSLCASLPLADSITFDTVENETSAYQPSLSILHGTAFYDSFTTPDDLRHAALIQSAHDWQTRRHPGMTSQSMRGVSIASGASYSKQPSHLLPTVQEVARRYRQYQ